MMYKIKIFADTYVTLGTSENILVYEGGILIHGSEEDNTKRIIYVCKDENGDYITHREDGPAYMYNGSEGWYVLYNLSGMLVHINDLPCDAEHKLFLHLKWGDNCGLL